MTHRIRRQILDLELPREAGAVALQRQLGRVFQEKVLPRLDEVFSKIAPYDRIVRLDRLEIDLGMVGETNWERNFVERCVEQITRQVTEAAAKAETAPDDNTRLLNPEENALAVFLYFLETGALPWYAKGLSIRTLEAFLIEITANRPEVFQQTLLPLLRRQKTALQRLLWQFSPGFTEKILDVALGLAPGWIRYALQLLASRIARLPDANERLTLYKALIEADLPEPLRHAPNAELLTQLYFRARSADGAPLQTPAGRKSQTDIVPPAPPPLSPVAPVPEQPGSDRAKTAFPPEGIMAPHAGVVLLGVYLPAFFEELNLLENNIFRNTDEQYRAIHLIHWLATGRENPEEPALVVPKLLCGFPAEEPVPAELALTDTEKNEADNLLKAAIQNWPALKNTSPDGLRDGFLQRMGHLSRMETQSAWLLRPERLGQDMLLERLPWSISVIKLPWMEEAIQVEW